MSRENIVDLNQFAKDLGEFLVDLQSIDASEGPVAGIHNFYRVEIYLFTMNSLKMPLKIIKKFSMNIC